MGTRDPRVDAYIAKSAPFARPILRRLRTVVHAACPEAEETLKWGAPHFLYRGMLCGMSAFKAHCAFGFWKGALIVDRDGAKFDEAMGQFGCIRRVADLPSRRVLAGYVKQAMRLNESGVKGPERSKRAAPKKPLRTPPDLAAALRRSRRAAAAFAAFAPSHRREYVEWILEAKRSETRARRLAQTIAWLTEGKRRNWKYERR